MATVPGLNLKAYLDLGRDIYSGPIHQSTSTTHWWPKVHQTARREHYIGWHQAFYFNWEDPLAYDATRRTSNFVSFTTQLAARTDPSQHFIPNRVRGYILVAPNTEAEQLLGEVLRRLRSGGKPYVVDPLDLVQRSYTSLAERCHAQLTQRFHDHDINAAYYCADYISDRIGSVWISHIDPDMLRAGYIRWRRKRRHIEAAQRMIKAAEIVWDA